MATQGRKPMPAAPAVPGTLNMTAVAEDLAAADQLIELRADYSEGRDLVNQLLGQAQMADAIAKLTGTVAVSKMAFVKEHKLYQALSGMKDRDGPGLAGTWEDFCKLLGKSASKVNEDIANLQTFGEAALESMSAMGIGYRELRQYRKLPEDQKLALIEVAKTGDKDSFVELAEEIIVKHAKEKEAIAANLQQAEEKLESKDRLIAQKNEHIDKLSEEIDRRFTPRPDSIAKTEAEQKLITEIQEATAAAQFEIRRVFQAADAALDGTAREAIELAARQAVEYLCQQLVDISAEFDIAVDLESRLKPAWMTDDMLAAMEARSAAAASQPAAPAKTKLKSVQGAAN
ncbi:hypothetical protein LHU53_15675 [Rhodoferax sp. U2-2l]|uniref:hypothetical protein n=1 Tax=Rhodoferax sp. U2-2l TaxID=2884000 RepID=UPI001D0AE77D|nr:hypothetical protein [Rhodoferax sp. U2-2l]MCB8748340.1 hypothetical protein [Rhodoferax sp. U2-2l]